MRVEPLDISGMLLAWGRGDEKALEEIIPLVYRDLRTIARRHLNDAPAPVVQSGTLAHEAYLKLIQARGIQCNSRAHFFALCSQIIRRILVDKARRRGAGKRGGLLQVTLDEGVLGSKVRGVAVEALDDALHSLAVLDGRKAKVVELRFFGGLTIPEAAAVLEISEETVTRDWRMARSWLSRELKRTAPPPL